MAWNAEKKSVLNYADVNDASLEEKIIRGVLKTRCECGRFVQAFRIVNTRDLPDEITNGQNWACDNCWTSWIRHDPRHQRTLNGEPFRMVNWLEAHGAPAQNIARQIANDAILHTRMMAKRQQIAATPADDGRTRELARIDDNINRMLDRARSPVNQQ